MDGLERYSTPLNAVFSRQHKLDLEHRVELALLLALSESGLCPAEAHAEASAAVAEGRVTLARTLEIERETQHDIMAVVKALTEQCPRFGGFVHFGATSQDVNDTVLALQMGECRAALLAASRGVRRELTRLASAHRATAAIGRTHGQHAIPVTMGFKFANFLYELSAAEAFLERVQVLGKFSGAVGTFASLGTAAVQASVMRQLGLAAAPISTQVVSRLHMLDFCFALAAQAAALERLAKEVRNLQRTEISELHEGFGAKQVGSSTMPQKRNPHKSERVCGLARLVRAQLGPALETVSLEHERDLTNSSAERISLPTAACLTHYMLSEMLKILAALHVDAVAVDRNLRAGGGRQLAERIMLALTGKLGRQAAHEVLRVHAGADDFVAAMQADPRVAGALSAKELADLLDPTTYIGLAPEIVDDIVARFGVPPAEAGAGAAAAAAAGAAGGSS